MMDEGTHYGVTTVDGVDLGQGVLTITTDAIETTSIGPGGPDLTWTFTDEAGHFHAWTWDKELPTLIRQSEHVGCQGDHTTPTIGDEEDDCGGWERYWFACRLCHAVVEPARLAQPDRTFIPGMRSWEVAVAGNFKTGQEVSVTFTARGRARWFGFGLVGTVGWMTEGHDPIEPYPRWPMATIHGNGPLGRMR